jgi:hypothetical protein
LKRFLDDKGRLFGKVNVVDIIVLVVIVAIVVFAAMRFGGGGSAESVTVKVTLVQLEVDNKLVTGLQSTGTVKDTAGNVIGDLQSIQIVPATVEVSTADGQLKAVPSTVKSTVTLVVKGTGTVSGTDVHIGKLAARVGAEVRIVGPGFEALTKISSVVWGAEALK